jgi:hypothetical protein
VLRYWEPVKAKLDIDLGITAPVSVTCTTFRLKAPNIEPIASLVSNRDATLEALTASFLKHVQLLKAKLVGVHARSQGIEVQWSTALAHLKAAY